MASDSIIARMGLDVSGVSKGMQEAVSRVSKGSADIGAASQRMERGIKTVTQSVISGAGAFKGMASAASSAFGAIGGGIGIAAAAGGVFAKFSQKISEASELANQIKLDIASIASGSGSGDFKTLDGMLSRVQEIDKVLEKISHSQRQGFSGLSGLAEVLNLPKQISRVASGHGFRTITEINKERAEDAQRARDDRRQDVRGILEKVSGTADISQTRNTVSERGASRAEINRKFDEQLGQAARATTGAISSNDPNEDKILAEINRQRQIELDALDRAAAAQDRQAEAAQRLLEVKRRGADVDLEAAQVAVELARANAAATAPEEKKRAAKLALESAEFELSVVERKTAELKAQLALQEKLANIQASPDAKAQIRNEAEAGLLQSRIDDPRTPEDERRGLRVDLAKNQEQARALARTRRETAYQAENSAIDATTGRGEGEQVEATRRKLAVAREKAGDLNLDPNASGAETQAAYAAVKQLENSLEEITEKRRLSVEYAGEESAIMRAALANENSLASKLQEKLRYEQQIHQAVKDGNQELAEQLRIQQRLALYRTGLGDFKKTASQRREEAAERRAEARTQHHYDRQVEEVKRGLANGISYSKNSRRGKIADDIRNGVIGGRDGSGGGNESPMRGTESKLDAILGIMRGGIVNQ